MSAGTDAVLTYVAAGRDPYVSLPVAMMEVGLGLSHRARLVRCYLHALARRPNWTIRVRQVQAALGLSEAQWVRARDELRAAGLYTSVRTRDAVTGRVHWQHIVREAPATIPADQGDGDPSPPKPWDGQPSHGKGGDIRSAIDTDTSKACTYVPPGGGAEPRRGKRHIVLPGGCSGWDPDDDAAEARLVQQYGEGAVRAAAAQLADAGSDPLPGRVASVLRQRAAAAEAAQRRREQSQAARQREADEARRQEAAGRRLAEQAAAIRRPGWLTPPPRSGGK